MGDQLVIYMRKSCPYCLKVEKFMKENDIQVPTEFIGRDEQARLELIDKGGKQQVPCLFVNGEAMYESDDIIEWMKNNLLS